MRHEWSSSVNHSLGKGDEKERKFTKCKSRKTCAGERSIKDHSPFASLVLDRRQFLIPIGTALILSLPRQPCWELKFLGEVLERFFLYKTFLWVIIS